MAAVDLAHETLEVLADAFASSDVTAAEVARALGLSEGRISQIRNGDGNLRISTLAKIMTVLGKTVELKVRPGGRRVKPVAKKQDRWGQLFVDGSGVRVHTYDLPHASGPWTVHPLGPPRKVDWHRFDATGQGPAPMWEVVLDEFIEAMKPGAQSAVEPNKTKCWT